MSMHRGGLRLDSQQAAKIAVFERRMLVCCTVSAAFGLFLWVISISTEYWYTVSCPNGVFINQTGLPGVAPGYLTYSHAGLWRSCKTLFRNGTDGPAGLMPAGGDARLLADVPHLERNGTEREVNATELEVNRTKSLSSPQTLLMEQTDDVCGYMRVKFRTDVDSDDPFNVVIAYRRTCMGFSVISMLLAGMAIFFSVYTFRVRRYTFKRVAACLHFMAAGTQLVVIEVKVTSVQYQRQYVPSFIPNSCTWNYSASFVLGWICFVISLAAGVGFLYTSSKKKKRPEGNASEDGAAEDEDDFDDEPQIMGR